MRSESQPSILEGKQYLKKSNSKHLYNRYSAGIFILYLIYMRSGGNNFTSTTNDGLW